MAVFTVTLFLRPAIRGALVRGISDKELLDLILSPYQNGVDLPVQGSRSTGRFLPLAIRMDGFNRLRACCQAAGIELHICGCKNSDLPSSRCHLVRSLSEEKISSTLLLKEFST